MAAICSKPLAKAARILLFAASPLALIGCSEGAGDGATANGEPIEPIAAPEGTSWTNMVAVSPEGGYIAGNPDAPIKLVEYASHTCGACANFAINGKSELKDDYVAAGTVSFEQREVFLNTFDVVIATLAQCGPKEQMQPLSDQVWRNLNDVMSGIQSNPDALNAAGELPLEDRFRVIGEQTGLIDFFASRGLSADQARSCLSDTAAIEEMVQTAETAAREDDITGTPTFFINGSRVDANQWSGVEAALQRAGAVEVAE